jgi:hypothetical protein
MEIQEAAERLIELGIPGKDERAAIKSRLVKKDSSRVKNALKDYVEKMLGRWAYTEGVIPKPEQNKNKDGIVERGRGKTSDWPQTTIEEAAAVWSVRQLWRKIHGGKKSRLSKERIDVIRQAASVVDERPFAIYMLPSVTGPLSTQRIAPEDIQMRFVSEECDGLDLFPGRDNAEKVDCLNKLVIRWVGATEKVRTWKSACIEAQMQSKFGSEWENALLTEKTDISHSDPWLKKVPCPWRIDQPARVALRWSSWGTSFFRLPTALLESDRDDLILLENFVDTRQFFKIDVSESAEWAKNARERIERQMRSSTSPMEQLTLSMLREFITTGLPYKD